MAKYRFDISYPGSDTIKIEADDGLIIDDWTDLSAPSCLIPGMGRFKIEPTAAVFSASGVEAFRLLGQPFNMASDDTGRAVIELAESGCASEGWTWKRVSGPG